MTAEKINKAKVLTEKCKQAPDRQWVSIHALTACAFSRLTGSEMRFYVSISSADVLQILEVGTPDFNNLTADKAKLYKRQKN
jgi:hypothetical protein